MAARHASRGAAGGLAALRQVGSFRAPLLKSGTQSCLGSCPRACALLARGRLPPRCRARARCAWLGRHRVQRAPPGHALLKPNAIFMLRRRRRLGDAVLPWHRQPRPLLLEPFFAVYYLSALSAAPAARGNACRAVPHRPRAAPGASHMRAMGRMLCPPAHGRCARPPTITFFQRQRDGPHISGACLGACLPCSCLCHCAITHGPYHRWSIQCPLP